MKSFPFVIIFLAAFIMLCDSGIKTSYIIANSGDQQIKIANSGDQQIKVVLKQMDTLALPLSTSDASSEPKVYCLNLIFRMNP
jgi:hypothetical protein